MHGTLRMNPLGSLSPPQPTPAHRWILKNERKPYKRRSDKYAAPVNIIVNRCQVALTMAIRLQIDEIKEKQAKGETLLPEQKEKLDSLKSLEDELAGLSL